VLQYIFPLMIVWWGRSFPAGLTIYWFVGTLFMCIQQHFVLSKIKKQRIQKEEEERYRKEHPELFPEEVEEQPVKPSEVQIIEEEDEEIFDEKIELEEVEDEYSDFYTDEELVQMKKDKEAARKKNKHKKKK
jgi:membrane protein insertase Oxa1/YidC/SpoIIIJ